MSEEAKVEVTVPVIEASVEVVEKIPATETKAVVEEEVTIVEESQAYFEPVVTLDEVDVVSGEEEEEVLFTMRSKVFEFKETLLDKGTGSKTWCERGVGNIRFLKHRESGKIRMLMRQEKTLKILINHMVDYRTELSPNMGSDRAWVWSCYDFSEGETEVKVFALRLANAENATLFKTEHDGAKSNNERLVSGQDAEETEAGDEAADALENLTVKEYVTIYLLSQKLTFINV